MNIFGEEGVLSKKDQRESTHHYISQEPHKKVMSLFKTEEEKHLMEGGRKD